MKRNKIHYNEIKLQEKSTRIGKGRRSMNKRFRTAFTDIQLSELQAEFASSSSLTSTRRKRISKKLALDEYTIKVWFQNQRQKNRRKRTKPTAGSYTTDRPESPQLTDDDFIQSEVEEEECLILPKQLPLEPPQLDRDIDILCHTPDPREHTEIRLSEAYTACHQPDKPKADCVSQPSEHVVIPPQHVVYRPEMCPWGQDVYTQQQFGYPAHVQQGVHPWPQQHEFHQQQVPAYYFQHQFYGDHMAPFMYQFYPYPYPYEQQYRHSSQQQIHWQYMHHQYIPQQPTRQQYDPSEDDEKLDIAKVIQNTIHYLS